MKRQKKKVGFFPLKPETRGGGRGGGGHIGPAHDELGVAVELQEGIRLELEGIQAQSPKNIPADSTNSGKGSSCDKHIPGADSTNETTHEPARVKKRLFFPDGRLCLVPKML